MARSSDVILEGNKQEFWTQFQKSTFSFLLNIIHRSATICACVLHVYRLPHREDRVIIAVGSLQKLHVGITCVSLLSCRCCSKAVRDGKSLLAAKSLFPSNVFKILEKGRPLESEKVFAASRRVLFVLVHWMLIKFPLCFLQL